MNEIKSTEIAFRFLNELRGQLPKTPLLAEVEATLEAMRKAEREQARETIRWEAPASIVRRGFRDRDDRPIRRSPASLVAEAIAALSLERCGIGDVYREPFRLYIESWVIPPLVQAYRKLEVRDGKKVAS